jgi:hypothetical protein
MKKIIFIPLSIILFCILSTMGSLFAITEYLKTAIPPSFQVTYAAIAGCNKQKQIQDGDGALFQEFGYLEPYIPYLFRWDQIALSDNFVISDRLVNNQSVFHLLLTASDIGRSDCDNEIIELAQHYQSRGAQIDQFNGYGMTPLQEAVITRNEVFVRLYLELGANKNLKVKSKNASIRGKDVSQIVQLFRERNPDDLQLARIERLLDFPYKAD